MKTAVNARHGLAEERANLGRRRTRVPFRRLGVLLAVSATALCTSGVASAATFTVNTVDDLVLGGCDVMHCSLREAIVDANANGPGHDLIAYNIALPAPNTITPATPYPPITSEVTIDGTTEPDYAGRRSSRSTVCWPGRVVATPDSGSLSVATAPSAATSSIALRIRARFRFRAQAVTASRATTSAPT